MDTVVSKDGTTIAFDRVGSGAPLVLVAGAGCDRAISTPIAQALAPHFTVLNHDRRGRGDSGDTLPFAVARELEDIEALIADAGGSAALLGFSSGAALAAEAAVSGLPVSGLIMWEPPFRLDAEGPREARAYAARLDELLAAGRRGDAVAHFMTRVGLPPEMIAGMRQSPYWEVGERMAPTLAYDAAVLGDCTIPAARYATITAPTLVLAGGASPEWMRTAAQKTAETIPGARFAVLDGQDHDVRPEALVPAAVGFLTA